MYPVAEVPLVSQKLMVVNVMAFDKSGMSVPGTLLGKGCGKDPGDHSCASCRLVSTWVEGPRDFLYLGFQTAFGKLLHL